MCALGCGQREAHIESALKAFAGEKAFKSLKLKAASSAVGAGIALSSRCFSAVCICVSVDNVKQASLPHAVDGDSAAHAKRSDSFLRTLAQAARKKVNSGMRKIR